MQLSGNLQEIKIGIVQRVRIEMLLFLDLCKILESKESNSLNLILTKIVKTSQSDEKTKRGVK